MPSPNPLVSVVIPAHNADDTILRALTSVWRQDYRPLEVIVVDDASTDGTRALVETLADRGVRLIALDCNRGASAARNAGIRAANGTFVAFLDADDEWMPHKTSRQMALIRDDPRVSFVACGDTIIAPSGEVIGAVISKDTPPATGPEAWRTLLAYSFVLTSGVIVRRTALEAVGDFDPGLPVAEDQDMWIRLALHGDVAYVDEPLVLKHDRPNSLSKDARIGARFMLPMITHHVRANRSRLSLREIAQIYGYRFTTAGRHAYYDGLWLPGAALLLRAIALGHRPGANLMFLLKSAPPTRWLKRRVMRY